jgi:hypothetical protein
MAQIGRRLTKPVVRSTCLTLDQAGAAMLKHLSVRGRWGIETHLHSVDDGIYFANRSSLRT